MQRDPPRFVRAGRREPKGAGFPMRPSSEAFVAATHATLRQTAAAPALADEAAPPGDITITGAKFAPAQQVSSYNFTSTHRDYLYVYGELGEAIPGTPSSIRSHLAHTGGGFDLSKRLFDYSVGITARYKNPSVVGAKMHRSDVARSGLSSGAPVSFAALARRAGAASGREPRNAA